MDTLSYTLLMIVVFIIGVLLFMRFETPRKMLNMGIQSLDKGINRLRNIQVIDLGQNRKKTPLIVGGNKEDELKHLKNNSKGDMGLYVHEY